MKIYNSETELRHCTGAFLGCLQPSLPFGLSWESYGSRFTSLTTPRGHSDTGCPYTVWRRSSGSWKLQISQQILSIEKTQGLEL